MNILQIKDKLDNDKNLKDTEIYNLYFNLTELDIDSTEIIENPKLIFKPLEELDEKYGQFDEFILPMAQLLEIKRRELTEFLNQLGSMYAEDKLEAFARKHLLIIKEEEEYKVYYPTNNREELINKLLYSNYAKMRLSEEYSIVEKEWYKLFAWTLE
jgi:hypothetical protein